MNKITSKFDGTTTSFNEVCAFVDPVLYKFISIISSSNKIKRLCYKERIVTWLSKLDIKIHEELKDKTKSLALVYFSLNLKSTSSLEIVEEKQRIALVYAKILTQYTPNIDGCIHSELNYFELVKTIKKVFSKHIIEDKNLFNGGLYTTVVNKCFYFKVQDNKIYIYLNSGSLLGKGGYGSVFKVFEIVSKKYFALKQAFPTKRQELYQEIQNLNTLHRCAQEMNVDVAGLQAAPYMTLDIQAGECSLNAYISTCYGMDLHTWINGNYSNVERLKMCKSLMDAYKNKTELGILHGDIKPKNILTHTGGCVIIDWAGALPFKDALNFLKMPKTFTTIYGNYLDYDWIRKIIICLKDEWKRNEEILSPCDWKEDELLKTSFVEIADTLELFSMAIVLFMTLSACYPFPKGISENGKAWPYTNEGILEIAMEKLTAMNYSQEVVQTIIKMLSHDYTMRYSTKEAIEIWEKIT